MLKVFFKAGCDKSIIQINGRNVVFTRADDEALPYGFVTEEEAVILAADPLYVVEGPNPADNEKPLAPKRGRKARA